MQNLRQIKLNPSRHSLTTLLLGIGASSAALAQEKLAVSVQTDAMQPVPYASVAVGQFGQAQQLLGDHEGSTPTIDNVLAFPSVVRLDETVIQSSGSQVTSTTIGQHFTYAPDIAPGTDGLRLTYFQPTARRVSLYAPYAVSDWIGGWVASGDDNATYGFEALVAELPTREVISNYTAYEIGMHADLFLHGLLIRVDDYVNLGAQGIHFRIDREGYDYGAAGPAMFTFAMGNPNLTSLLATTVTGLDAENVEFRLQGYLSPGDNLILFLHPNPGAFYPADPLGVISGGDEGGGDCTLPAPACKTDGTCPPPLPSGAVMGGATTCTDKWVKLGPELKPGCGSTAGFDVCTEWKGGVSWKVKIGVPETFEFEIGADGEVGGSHCTNVTASGGWKVQAYQCYKLCERTWDCTYVPWYSIFPRHYHKTTSCVIPGGITTATCQFETCQ